MFGKTDRLVYTVPLGEIRREPDAQLYFTEDRDSTEIVLCFRDENGGAADVSGCTAALNFIRPDGVTVVTAGTVEDDQAFFTVSGTCLTAAGGGTVYAVLTRGNARKIVWTAEAVIRRSATDTYADPDNLVPSLSDLLAEIDTMRTATAQAQGAASAAQTAADNIAGEVAAVDAKAEAAGQLAANAAHNFVQLSEPAGARTGDLWTVANVSTWDDLGARTWSSVGGSTWAGLVDGSVTGLKVYVFGNWKTLI